MRSYREYCSLAKSLDVIGDRWSLLVIRELAIRGACRYSDLQDGLPAISTNLLADRLRELVEAGVVARREPRPPVATPVFELTEHGHGLEPIMRALMDWGVSYMVDGPAPEDHFRAHWLSWPAEQYLEDRDPSAAPVRIELNPGGEEAVAIDVADGRVSVASDPGEREPDTRLSGTPHALLGLMTGHLGLSAAQAAGVAVQGSRSAVERVLPREPPRT